VIFGSRRPVMISSRGMMPAPTSATVVHAKRVLSISCWVKICVYPTPITSPPDGANRPGETRPQSPNFRQPQLNLPPTRRAHTFSRQLDIFFHNETRFRPRFS
jgi:hypothetical protein